MKGELNLRYSPDADAMVISVKDERPAYGDEKAPGIILHYNNKDELVEIEILDASELLSKAVQEIARRSREALIKAEAIKRA